MQAVNIRQLKSNPSQALKSAREGDLVVVMNRDQPEAILVDLHKLDGADPAAVRTALAVSLFRNGSISAGFGARMSGKPVAEFLALLSRLGIPLTADSPAEAAAEFDAGKRVLDSLNG